MNDYLEFKKLLSDVAVLPNKPTLLLHSCCGPCSSYPLELLIPYFKITIYYYNPNIYPDDEFYYRANVQQELLKKLNLDIDFVIEYANHDVYEESIKEYNTLKEGSMRCYKCYEFRIKKTSEYASKHQFDYFTTVMSVSPYKNSLWINELGKKYEHDSKFLYSNFKKEEGYKKSISLSKKYNLYRQDYCGCEYSIREHEEMLKNKHNL